VLCQVELQAVVISIRFHPHFQQNSIVLALTTTGFLTLELDFSSCSFQITSKNEKVGDLLQKTSLHSTIKS